MTDEDIKLPVGANGCAEVISDEPKTHPFEKMDKTKRDSPIKQDNNLITYAAHCAGSILDLFHQVEDQRKDTFTKASDNIKKSQQHQKKNFDARHCGGEIFAVGTKVMKRNTKDLNTYKKMKGDRWIGPYTVLGRAKVGGYFLKDRYSHKLTRPVPAQHLCKYHSRSNEVQNLESPAPMKLFNPITATTRAVPYNTPMKKIAITPIAESTPITQHQYVLMSGVEDAPSSDDSSVDVEKMSEDEKVYDQNRLDQHNEVTVHEAEDQDEIVEVTVQEAEDQEEIEVSFKFDDDEQMAETNDTAAMSTSDNSEVTFEKSLAKADEMRVRIVDVTAALGEANAADFVNDTDKMLFSPLTNSQRQKAARSLMVKIDPEKWKVKYSGVGTPLKVKLEDKMYFLPPKEFRLAKPDGACLFNSISILLCGDDRFAQIIRHAVCTYLCDERNHPYIEQHIRPEYIDGKTYVLRSNMRLWNTWGTDREIIAIAQMTGFDVVVFSSKRHWCRYSHKRLNGTSNTSAKTPSSNCLYLSNVSGGHFDPVTHI